MITVHRIIGALLATVAMMTSAERRDDRGGSSSTIEVLLIIGLVIGVCAIAAIGIRAYVVTHLP